MTKYFYTDATHNMQFNLGPKRWKEDLEVSTQADIIGFQEAGGDFQRKTLTEFLINIGYEYFYPMTCPNPIAWNPEVFDRESERAPFGTTIIPHGGSGSDKYLHERHITSVGLVHKNTGKRVFRINVHPSSGGLGKEKNNDRPALLDDWVNWSLEKYWLSVVQLTARTMWQSEFSGEVGHKHPKRWWDIVTIGGDYNATMLDFDRWYYPSMVLGSLYNRDFLLRGIDHLQHALGSDVMVMNTKHRWQKPVNSDHDVHFVRRRILNVHDHPGE